MATKKEGDGEHPSSHYLVVEDAEKPSTWRLRVRGRDGKPDHGLMGAAYAALYKNYRGNTYEGPNKEEAKTKLRALYKSEDMVWPGDAEDREIEGSGDLVNSSPDGPMIRLSDQPRFVMLLAEAPTSGLIRIPIAVTGEWKGAEKEFSVGLDDLNEIRSNFAKKPTGEINVDYEHASEVPFGTGGPVLSAGRVVKLDEPEKYAGSGDLEIGRSRDRMNSSPDPPIARSSDHSMRYILWGWFEPTDRARQLIASNEYRYISPAIRWGAKDKVTGKAIGTVLTSIALVNKPFLEELPQIHLSEVAGDQTILVSLGQLHVPGPVNQVSVAYRQPKKNNVGPSGARPEENEMAKSLKLKCLTDAHLEKHDLPKSHLGKIGVFDGDELMGVADDGPDGWEKKDGNGDGKNASAPDQTVQGSEVFASEVGMPGKSPAEIAALVKLGIEAAGSTGTSFNMLMPAIHDGHINLSEAGALADQGKVRFSTIMLAQEAERKVDAAVKAGKILPKNRQHALRVALSDAAAFSALVEEAKPVVDLRSHGHAGGGEATTAQQALMAEVNAYAKENKCSVSVALSEVTKRKPDLWREYSEEIVAVSEAASEEE